MLFLLALRGDFLILFKRASWSETLGEKGLMKPPADGNQIHNWHTHPRSALPTFFTASLLAGGCLLPLLLLISTRWSYSNMGG